MARQPRSEHIEGLEARGIEVVESPGIEPITGNPDLARIAAEEAFMNDFMKIMIFPTTDANASPYATLSVNGERVIVRRAVKTVVKRKHVEVLARMKETRYSQDLNPNSNGEITTDSVRGHSALAYPFTVLEDPSPKGGAWLEHILAEAN